MVVLGLDLAETSTSNLRAPVGRPARGRFPTGFFFPFSVFSTCLLTLFFFYHLGSLTHTNRKTTRKNKKHQKTARPKKILKNSDNKTFGRKLSEKGFKNCMHKDLVKNSKKFI
jgi:hypothetical protein